MTTELIVAKESEKETLKNLYSLYLHDLSLYSEGLQPNENGLFEFDAFHLIWEKEGIHPYLIKVDGHLAGFFLLLSAPLMTKVDYCINDFFLLNQYRGQGIGEQALDLLFETHQGNYFVEQLKSNERAVQYWKKIFKRYGFSYEEKLEVKDGEECVGQFFQVSLATSK
ncbi:GNAT family N-acetyltransferase [Bacillus sp. 31A1R]|uniref:GNAT family N-acetyltransferase n=1 Tax=Robertmurraya mangrovi TaxID=3098077 RepID=A0ABU5IX38_9BACI|nr:GNAT family N-acetyltransferase [Bacillus sp. 31A1R]MDZ5471722.1 GNAT family N-acetyltransferase [Bacillus sp. 31A1R]